MDSKASLDPLWRSCQVKHVWLISVTCRAISLAVTVWGVFALLHSVQSLGLSPFFTFYTHSSLHQNSPQRDKLQSWRRGLILLYQLLLSEKDLKEASVLLCDGRCLGWDLGFFRHSQVLEIFLMCCSCETTFPTPLFFLIAWDSSHKGPRCHPCAVAEGARVFSFEAYAAAVWHPVWAGEAFTAVCWNRASLLWW